MTNELWQACVINSREHDALYFKVYRIYVNRKMWWKNWVFPRLSAILTSQATKITSSVPYSYCKKFVKYTVNYINVRELELVL